MTSGIMRDSNERRLAGDFVNETAPLVVPFFYDTDEIDILESFHLIFDLGVHIAVTVLIDIMRI